MNATVRELELQEFGIVEASLCDSSIHVAHHRAGESATKFQTRNKRYHAQLLYNDILMSEKGMYIDALSRRGLINSSHELSILCVFCVCSN